jgi:hypothetical protein
MSCCHDSEKLGLTSLVFVMPVLTLSLAEDRDGHAVEAARQMDMPRPMEPASPPPRIECAVL